MSYCVHCGVELGGGAKACPLCGTPVLDPAAPKGGEEPAFFPTRPAEVAPVSKRVLALLLTAMLASVSLCCALLNLVLKPQMSWYLLVVGAAAMLWVWAVFPLLARKVPLWGRLTLDVGAVGLYVFLISLAFDGGTWFRGLAVPLLVLSTATVFCLSWLLRRGHSMLTTLTMGLSAAGIYAVGVELCCDWFFRGGRALGWSLVVFACCVGLCIPLIVVRRVPSLREEARRRFHF